MRNLDNDRDRSIERLLRETLGAQAAAPPSGACLDAETAAAWADETLGPRDRAKAETHAAGCARCQALLAALVRTSPPAPVHSWFRLSTIGWLAPLTAVAAGLIVLATLPRARLGDRAPARVDAVATAPAPPVSGAPAESKLEAPAADRKAALTEPLRKKDAAVLDERAKNKELDRLEQGAAAAPSAPSAKAFADAPAPSAAAKTAPPVAAPAPASAEAQNAVSAGAAGAQQKMLMSRAAAGGLVTKRANDVRQPTLIASTNPRQLWQIGTDGAVLHTVDGGSTWETQRTGVAVTLTAGASPSPSVCWLVGPSGIVVLTTDGRSWQTIPFQEKVDLVAVRATNEKTATVTAADGRTFSTTDGGVTWTPFRNH